jgi:hypothetical protein
MTFLFELQMKIYNIALDISGTAEESNAIQIRKTKKIFMG